MADNAIRLGVMILMWVYRGSGMLRHTVSMKVWQAVMVAQSAFTVPNVNMVAFVR